jgi:hypothetical protein
VARESGAVAYGFAAKVLLVAIADPTDEPAMEAVREAVERRARFVVATASEIAAAQRDAFGEPFSAAAEQLV